jgi:dTDP-4-amino-4,6-dideoxygalactose transaminase
LRGYDAFKIFLNDHRELEEISQCLPRVYFTQAPKWLSFEKLVKDLVGVRYCVCDKFMYYGFAFGAGCTGIAPGDEVLSPISRFLLPVMWSYNWVLSQFWLILIWILSRSILMIFARKFTSRTKAIIPVHAFGLFGEYGANHAAFQERNNSGH